MSTIGERLHEAIKVYGPRPPGRPGAEGSVNQFHKLLKELVSPGAGSSYQTLWRVIGGEAQPSGPFLEATLGLLPQVRREWLEGGEGAITHVREAMGTASGVEIDDGGNESFGLTEIVERVLPEFQHLPPVAKALVWSLLGRFSDAAPREWFRSSGEMDDSQLIVFANLVRQYALGPLLMWGKPDYSDRRTEDFLCSALSTLLLSIPEQIVRKPILFVSVPTASPNYQGEWFVMGVDTEDPTAREEESQT